MSMSYCLNPYCRQPENPSNANTCSSCNYTILLDSRYRPINYLGGGGQGRNYLAIDERTPTQKRCVIKQFCPHPNIASHPESLKKATELFNREATILDSIGDESPQIPRLLAHLEQEGLLYFVQEFIDGNNLLSLLSQKGTYSEAEVNDFLNEILPVLKFIHNRSVIHRDIKPENIMRRKDGLFVLIDFGLSKQLSSTVMVMGTIAGTQGYAPREQIVYGEAYPASDLYALGATCIHLLTGIPPHNLYNPQENRWLWQDILLQRGVRISDYLNQILKKMLMENVADRYQSVDEVLEGLQPAKTVVVNTERQVKQSWWQKAIEFINLSENYIDYQNLQTLLKRRDWKKADQETEKLLFHLMDIDYKNGNYFDIHRGIYSFQKDISKEIEFINNLWTHYSKEKFGFRVQKNIMKKLGFEWQLKRDSSNVDFWLSYIHFGEVVGWNIKGEWLNYDESIFDLKAPKGHLPRIGHLHSSYFEWGDSDYPGNEGGLELISDLWFKIMDMIMIN